MNYTELYSGPGIYKITNKNNGKCYIGSSVNCRKRIYNHQNLLVRNKHDSIILQRAWNKHGHQAFVAEVICCVLNADQLILVEQLFMNELQPYYNISKIADRPTLGWKPTPETREKMRMSHLGKRMTESAKEKIRQFGLGRKMNFAAEIIEASKERMRKMDRSYMQTEEYKEKCVENGRERQRRIGKKFICRETNQIFSSTGDAARELNISYKMIWRCLKHQRSQTHGYTFSYI